MVDEDKTARELQTIRSRQMVHLSEKLRWSSATVGLLMAGFAGYAIYRGTDGVATTAFVAAAALFVFLAIAGVIPSRIRSGEHEVEMFEEAIDQTVAAATEQMNQAEIAEFSNALALKAQQSPNRAIERAQWRGRQAAIFEMYLMNLLHQACIETGLTLADPHLDLGIDAFVTNGDKTLPVIIKQQLGPTGLIRQMRRYANSEYNHLAVLAMDVEDLTPFEFFDQAELLDDSRRRVTIILPNSLDIVFVLARVFNVEGIDLRHHPPNRVSSVTLAVPLRGNGISRG